MFPIDVRDARPIYEQIVDQIKEQVMKGMLKPKDQVPSVRQLAQTLGINPNTVTKAYQALEREQVIETIRGRGTFVCEKQIPCMDNRKLETVRTALKSQCVSLHYMGFTKKEIIQEVEAICNELIREEKE